MYELIQVGERTYYIECPAKMGLYRTDDTHVILIDSGNNKDAAKKALKHITAQGWELTAIVNTHSHADHIGGNGFLQEKTGCQIFTADVETAFTQFPILESSYLYGGYPVKELRNKFLLAQASQPTLLTADNLPSGLELLRLDGHSLAMIAIKTSDNVWFLADTYTSPAIMEKYHISFLCDVQGYVDSLNAIKTLEGDLFIPSHGEPTTDVTEVVDLNLAKVEEIKNLLLNLCATPKGIDQILKEVFDHYGLTMYWGQYVLVGSTIRCYLAHLHQEGLITTDFSTNQCLFVEK